MNSKNTIVSIILLAENAPEEQIDQHIIAILNQSYKNIDLIVSYTNDNNITQLMNKWNNSTFNIKWYMSNPGLDIITNSVKECIGDIIFYKTINPIFWYPRHIQHHLDIMDEKHQLSFSFIEYKDVAEQNQMLNIIGYRIDQKPQTESIILDEIVHYKDYVINWNSCVVQIQNNIQFLPGLIFNNIKTRISIPKEITVIQWRNTKPINTQEELSKQLGMPKSNSKLENIIEDENGNLKVKAEFPSVVGNKIFEEYNKKVKNEINLIDKDSIKTIAIKRSMGMGDVLLVEPIIRALQKKYKNAEFTLFTENPASNIVKYFESKPNIVIVENQLIFDYLTSVSGYDLRYDLDLSYESRQNYNYIDAYFEICGYEEEIIEDEEQNLKLVKYVNDDEKIPKIVYNDNSKLSNNEKWISVDFAGSGWKGKELDLDKCYEIVKYFSDNGYSIAFTSNLRLPSNLEQLKNYIINNNDFDTMINYIKYSEFHIGADNGAMHVSTALNKKSIIIAGAALPKFSSPSKNITTISNEQLNCLHCKGKQFFNQTNNDQITFVAACTNNNQYECMTGLNIKSIIDQIQAFLSLNK